MYILYKHTNVQFNNKSKNHYQHHLHVPHDMFCDMTHTQGYLKAGWSEIIYKWHSLLLMSKLL